MRERPIADLVEGLTQLGVDAVCSLGTGCPPVAVNAEGLPSGKVGLSHSHHAAAAMQLACLDSKCMVSQWGKHGGCPGP